MDDFRKLDLDALMSLEVEDITPDEIKIVSDKNLFKADMKKAKDGVYSAILRFLPNPVNPKDSRLEVKRHYLKGEKGGTYFVCPSTVGLPDSFIQKAFWEFHNKFKATEDPVAKVIKDNLSRNDSFYSLVYVVKDDCNPDNTGKIMVFNYTKVINKKIMDELNPSQKDIDDGTKVKTDVFSLVKGRNFSLKVETSSFGIIDYKNSTFVLNTSPFALELKTKDNITNSQEVMDKLKELYATTPNLREIYGYKEWAEEQTHEAKKLVAYITGQDVRDGERLQVKDAPASRKVIATALAEPTASDTDADDELIAYLNASS